MIKLQTRRTRFVWQWNSSTGTGQDIQDGTGKLSLTTHGAVDINHDNLVLQGGTDILLRDGTYWINGAITQDYAAGVTPNHLVLAFQLWRDNILVAWFNDHQLAPYSAQAHMQVLPPISIVGAGGAAISIRHAKIRPAGVVGAAQQVRFGSPSFIKVTRVTA